MVSGKVSMVVYGFVTRTFSRFVSGTNSQSVSAMVCLMDTGLLVWTRCLTECYATPIGEKALPAAGKTGVPP
jgi:hypothetical protein